MFGLIYLSPFLLKATVTTDHSSCRLICRTRGGQRRHKKTDDSISVKTRHRFNLLSIQSAPSLSESISFLEKKIKTLRARAGCQTWASWDKMLCQEANDFMVKPNYLDKLSGHFCCPFYRNHSSQAFLLSIITARANCGSEMLAIISFIWFIGCLEVSAADHWWTSSLPSFCDI